MIESRFQDTKLKLKAKRQQAKTFCLKNRKSIALSLILGLGCLGLLWQHRQLSRTEKIEQPRTSSSLVSLRSLSPVERSSRLKSLAIAKDSRMSPDRRARTSSRSIFASCRSN